MLQFELNARQKALQAKVRDFAIREILPAIWHYEDKDEIPLFLLRRAFDLGIMNSDIPKKYGGIGALSNPCLTNRIQFHVNIHSSTRNKWHAPLEIT